MALYALSSVAHKPGRLIQNYANHYGTGRKVSAKSVEYKKCCRVLEIPESSDHEQIRQAYLHLAKRYHPDNPGGNLQKFQEIDHAFRTLVQKHARERWDVEDEYEMDEEAQYDIKHTAPQHRQYLSNEGVGSGTPFQREKQYMKMRVMNAADNVLKHRVAKVTADEKTLLDKKPLKHKIKTKYGFDRLVEDLIQESMSKGEFSNLAGSGKPLKTHSDTNPFVDFVTHKINKVLIENGFTPEWITLQKEIREEIAKLRRALAVERQRFGPAPLAQPVTAEWEAAAALKFADEAAKINKKIDKFNLVVPIMNKQMMQICLKREAERLHAAAAEVPPENRAKEETHEENGSEQQRAGKNIISLFEAYFKF